MSWYIENILKYNKASTREDSTCLQGVDSQRSNAMSITHKPRE
jgi:hypothetical protein